MFRLMLVIAMSLAVCGCMVFPDVAHQPVVQNPFPQLTRIAVAPFFNLSNEPTVDGERFALAYYNELQAIPGFEVVPVSVVKTAMQQYRLQLDQPGAARRLAQLLEVDAVVVGAVTDYSPYYPPRCGLHVQWWAANPCFHPIPAGYGLPWGTTEEEFIPEPVVYEAEMALAREQLKTQTPDYDRSAAALPAPSEPALLPVPANQRDVPPPNPERQGVDKTSGKTDGTVATTAQTGATAPSDAGAQLALTGPISPDTPADWPDARGFVPPGPSCNRPDCMPTNEPVLKHTRVYHGNDGEFTEALASYEYFRDDARFGGWQAYLQRSEDFIRFCCHMHICEMLTSRGGAGETQVVWRWFRDR